MAVGSLLRIRRRSLVWLTLTIAWAGMIFALSALPNLRFLPDEAGDYVFRKAGHVAIFGLLAVLAWRTAVETTAVSRPALLAFLLTVTYAVSDEVHQGFTEGRYPSLRDVGFDSIGAALSLLLALWLANRWSRS